MRRPIFGVMSLAIGVTVLSSCGSSPKPASTTATTKTTAKANVTTSTAPQQTYPLTGMPIVAGGPNPTRPALMVKIDNAPPAWPQSGINNADVVYEEMVEGGLTRYMAVFQSQNASKVGPIRSIRGTDVALTAQTTGLIAYSGGIPTFISEVRSTGVVDVGANAASGVYYRDPGRPAPHNLYSSTPSLYGAAGSRGVGAHALFSFGSPGVAIPSALSSPAAAITLTISGSTVDTWTYQPSAQDWTKAINGTAVTDTTGTPINATNLIIEFVPYTNTGFVDPAGHPVPEAGLVGTGSAYFAFGGAFAAGTWSKSSNSAVPTYQYSAGEPLKLRPGRTWVIFAPIGASFKTTP